MTTTRLPLFSLFSKTKTYIKLNNKRSQNFKIVRTDLKSKHTINLSGSNFPVIITKNDKVINIPIECNRKSKRVEVKVNISNEPFK